MMKRRELVRHISRLAAVLSITLCTQAHAAFMPQVPTVNELKATQRWQQDVAQVMWRNHEKNPNAVILSYSSFLVKEKIRPKLHSEVDKISQFNGTFDQNRNIFDPLNKIAQEILDNGSSPQAKLYEIIVLQTFLGQRLKALEYTHPGVTAQVKKANAAFLDTDLATKVQESKTRAQKQEIKQPAPRTNLAQQQPPPPLVNLGQNCSFNALLQILFCLTPFNEALKQLPPEKLTDFLKAYVSFLSIKNNPPDPATNIAFDLEKNPWVPDRSGKISRIILQPLWLWMQIHKGLEGHGAFDDPSDILRTIKKQCSPEIQGLFSTKLAVERTCPLYTSIEPDNQHLHEADKTLDVDFFTIPITEENQKLESSLAAYQPEGLPVKKCSKVGCGKDTIVSTKVLETPEILIIKTERTKVEGNLPQYVYQINNFKLEYPTQGLRFGNASYDLAGIISYLPYIKNTKQNNIFTFEPTFESHYYAIVRHNGIAYHCNDQYIAPITNEEEFNKAFGTEKKHESFDWAQEARYRYTYLLFYLKERDK
jgi:hypothetical protein